MDQANQLNWYVLYTKSRHEKFVEDQFLQKGIEAFTPKVTLRKGWSDRIKYIQEPIFKGYCFAKFSLYEKTRIIIQPGVAGIVHFKDQYIPVAESTIESLKILSSNKVMIDLCPYIKTGDYVRIRKGPLKGVEGFVLEKTKKNTRLVVSVETIASAIKCVVGIDCVELS